MTAYAMYQGWVLKEIDGVEIDGKSYTIKQIKAALEAVAKSPAPQTKAMGIKKEKSSPIDLVSRLLIPSDNEEVMSAWGTLRAYLLKGGKGSYARDIFENILSNIDEEREEAANYIKELENKEPIAWYRENFVFNFSLGPTKPKNDTGNPLEWKPLYDH